MRKLQLKKQCRAMCNGRAIAGACLLTAVWLIVLGIVGSPRLILHLLSKRIWVVPSWLFLVLIMLFYVVCGMGIGAVLLDRRCSSFVGTYRGAFFFSIGITLSYLWYALFFGARYLLPALILSFFAFACLLITAINFHQIRILSAKLIGIGAGIMVYFFALTIFSFFFL